MSKTSSSFEFDDNAFYFVPLGGSEQFGVNLNLYVNNGKMLVIDCGLGFADERFPGIDIVLPDPSFLEDRKEDIDGLIITHAHEDHIGAVAHLWERLRCPIYATRFTAVALGKKLDERGLHKVPVHIIEPLATPKIGEFKVQFLPVAHSIPGCVSLMIETDHGKAMHSGDWNMDPRPVIGSRTEAKSFQAAAKGGVLAYIGDSTNAEVPGRAGSEGDVQAGLEAEFRKCEGRILVTIFSSNIGRIISIVKAAEACGRDVGVIGRSLHRMIGSARTCGYMDDIPEFVDEKDLGFLPDDKTVIIATGSQGEYRAALAKIARGDHHSVSLNKKDTVIFSARAIPGNDRNINEIKNNLSAAGISIVTPSDTESLIHVSGHPCQDEISEMFQWLKPSLVIPVHGERTQLDAHARLAEQSQVPQTIVPNNGSVIKLAPGKPEVVDHVETGLLAVDLKRLVRTDHQSIVARRKLQYTGALHASLAVDAKGRILGEPRLETVGLIDENTAEIEIEDNVYDQIFTIFDDMSSKERQDDDFIAEELRIGLRRFIYKTLGFKPKTTIHVIRV